jgi:Sec-independent protein translocase protein TatA
MNNATPYVFSADTIFLCHGARLIALYRLEKISLTVNPCVSMLGIGFFEIVIIALVCFIAIGPKQLPAVMRKVAQFYRQFASLREELRFQMMSIDDDLKSEKEVAAKQNSKPAEDVVVVAREQGHG